MTPLVLASLFALSPAPDPCPPGPELVPCTLRLLGSTLVPPDLLLFPASAGRDDQIDAGPAMARPSFEWSHEMTLAAVATLAAAVLIPACWGFVATFRS